MAHDLRPVRLVRWFLPSLFLVLAIVWIAMNQQTLTDADHKTQTTAKDSLGQWRYTAQGWRKDVERPDQEIDEDERTIRWTVHPLAVATLQLLLSIGALIAFDPDTRRDK